VDLLSLQTLVLDRGFIPIRRVHWTRAVSMWWVGRAEVLEEYGLVARSPSMEIPIPAVVRHLRGEPRRRWTVEVRFSRRALFLRDGGRCQYCGRKLPFQLATHDHVVPRSRGGQTVWDNVLLACLPCNQRKGARMPEEARMKPLSLPRRPKPGSIPAGPRGEEAQLLDIPPLWLPYLGRPLA